MRLINKGIEPSAFVSWKKKNPGQGYDQFSKTPEYYVVRDALLKEQGYICCYCEKRIKGKKDCSIEHFMPRHPENLSGDEKKRCVDAELDYSNMLISCEGDYSSINLDHCNHKKSNWFDFDLCVSPTNPEIMELFEYSENGKIKPKNNDIRATEMIRRLNLDTYVLRELRKAAYDTVIENEFEDETLWDDKEYIKATMELYLALNGDGQYYEFCSMICDCLKRYL